MNDDELKKTFPYGVTVIPRDEDLISYTAAVGGEGDDEDTFTVWENAYHEHILHRALTPKDDGYLTQDLDGRDMFLRPLDEAHKVVL